MASLLLETGVSRTVEEAHEDVYDLVAMGRIEYDSDRSGSRIKYLCFDRLIIGSNSKPVYKVRVEYAGYRV